MAQVLPAAGKKRDRAQHSDAPRNRRQAAAPTQAGLSWMPAAAWGARARAAWSLQHGSGGQVRAALEVAAAPAAALEVAAAAPAAEPAEQAPLEVAPAAALEVAALPPLEVAALPPLVGGQAATGFFTVQEVGNWFNSLWAEESPEAAVDATAAPATTGAPTGAPTGTPTVAPTVTSTVAPTGTRTIAPTVARTGAPTGAHQHALWRTRRRTHQRTHRCARDVGTHWHTPADEFGRALWQRERSHPSARH